MSFVSSYQQVLRDEEGWNDLLIRAAMLRQKAVAQAAVRKELEGIHEVLSVEEQWIQGVQQLGEVIRTNPDNDSALLFCLKQARAWLTPESLNPERAEHLLKMGLGLGTGPRLIDLRTCLQQSQEIGKLQTCLEVMEKEQRWNILEEVWLRIKALEPELNKYLFKKLELLFGSYMAELGNTSRLNELETFWQRTAFLQPNPDTAYLFQQIEPILSIQLSNLGKEQRWVDLEQRWQHILLMGIPEQSDLYRQLRNMLITHLIDQGEKQHWDKVTELWKYIVSMNSIGIDNAVLCKHMEQVLNKHIHRLVQEQQWSELQFFWRYVKALIPPDQMALFDNMWKELLDRAITDKSFITTHWLWLVLSDEHPSPDDPFWQQPGARIQEYVHRQITAITYAMERSPETFAQTVAELETICLLGPPLALTQWETWRNETLHPAQLLLEQITPVLLLLENIKLPSTQQQLEQALAELDQVKNNFPGLPRAMQRMLSDMRDKAHDAWIQQLYKEAEDIFKQGQQAPDMMSALQYYELAACQCQKAREKDSRLLSKLPHSNRSILVNNIERAYKDTLQMQEKLDQAHQVLDQARKIYGYDRLPVLRQADFLCHEIEKNRSLPALGELRSEINTLALDVLMQAFHGLSDFLIAAQACGRGDLVKPFTREATKIASTFPEIQPQLQAILQALEANVLARR